MSDEPETPLDLASIKTDLERSFLPVWAKESETSERIFRMGENYAEHDRREHGGGRRGPRGPRQDWPARRGEGGRRPGRRDSRQGERRPEPASRPVPSLVGWEVRLKPDPRGVEGVAKQIKAGAKAYRLFDLAWLVLEKAERYRVEFKRVSEDATALFQLRIDGSVWPSEREAVGHVMAHHMDKFYRRERVATDPPKGAYPFVAVCGMSGVLLGPPNYHDYQAKIRKLHAERFANVPFDVYRGRIRMDRDEASIQKWKEEQSSKEEFYPVECPEGTEPVKLGNTAEVERHFLQNHAGKCIARIAERAMVPGLVALNASTPSAVQLVRRALDELRGFPLPLAHTLGQQLRSKGLQIFKAHQNVTYVSIAQPRYLDRKAMPVADGVSAILEYLEAHASTPRAEQWRALVASRATPVGGTDAERESALAADLLWLLREGHVIDFARRGLEVARRPKAPAAVGRGRPKPRGPEGKGEAGSAESDAVPAAISPPEEAVGQGPTEP
ncbi:MAG TPA: hypothetical protein PLU30_07780 [Verrucomicrobiae bacterium]|nr:hypothetical protein [Verrucomicrobiae bacterium]